MSDDQTSNFIKVSVSSPEEADTLRADVQEIMRRVNRSLEREPTAQPPVRVDILLQRIDQIIDLHLLALPATPNLLALAHKIKAAAKASVLEQAKTSSTTSHDPQRP